jgi:hypothetical protein
MRNRHPVLALLVLVALASMGAWGGCDLFTPAAPEVPVNTVTVRENFTDPESTLATMVNAFLAQAYGVSGSDAYIDALANPSDGAVFGVTFDPIVVAETGKPAPGVWGIAEERQFFDKFVGLKMPPGKDSLVWTPIETRPDSDYVAGDIFKVLNRRYEVWNIYKPKGGATTTMRYAVGYAHLTFQKVTRGWVVIMWDDATAQDPGIPTTNNDRTFTWRRLE